MMPLKRKTKRMSKPKDKQWKPVAVDEKMMLMPEFDDFGGIEELTSYNIISNNAKDADIKKRKKQCKKKKNMKQKFPGDDLTPTDFEASTIDMSAWINFFLPEPIISALGDLGFKEPTPIQALSIPAAVRDHQDILGAAETGSGKTLAFGIPVVSGILSLKENGTIESDGISLLYCLVLTPTRELAIQVKKHLQAVCKYTDIKVSVIVGGMAPEKQKRILKKCPEIVVATPGRLWEMIDEGEEHLNQLHNIKYLVIDEADRMVEKGHFAELKHILNLINGKNSNQKRHTFVFSATLTLVHELPNRLILKKRGKIQNRNKLDSLIKMIGMKDNHKILDITKNTAVVQTLTESQIMCSTEEKDMYLYYFLVMYPGRTLVFCNSIDCVRRLRTILEYLNCHPLPLHASMHQRQRLKNLDKFTSSKDSVLLATDVAARGLDIEGIEHVIHFQVPRTAETYVHRSGRTARAQSEGLSLILVESQDAVFYKRICKTLNKDKALPNFPIDYTVLKVVRERVNFVHSIDKMEHRLRKHAAQNRWFLNTAKEMDIDIEDENLLNDLGDEQEYAAKCRQIEAMKKQLKVLLNKTLTPRTHTGGYPTMSGKLVNSVNAGNEKAIRVLKKRKLL